MVEVDEDSLWKYTGYVDNELGFNANYKIFADEPVLDTELYADKLDKTLICYENQVLNFKYLELPIYMNKGTFFPSNKYTMMMDLTIDSYPKYNKPKCEDILLEDNLKYKITQGCQKMLKYVRSIQNDVKDFIANRYNKSYTYTLEGHNLPFKSYPEMVEFAAKESGKLTAKIFIARYLRSYWFREHTPNAWVDAEKLKLIIEEYGIKMNYNDLLDDEDWMGKHANRYKILDREYYEWNKYYYYYE
jgi:hypothetical protein